jgi:hypothetical protein
MNYPTDNNEEAFNVIIRVLSNIHNKLNSETIERILQRWSDYFPEITKIKREISRDY